MFDLDHHSLITGKIKQNLIYFRNILIKACKILRIKDPKISRKISQVFN